ncbi:hypothetical protein [Nonomuraea bangladeshensis]|uniref:hypothetical protein n=1 Tax=Nonomuraea bangladeshensis TaxID=404385 RepID=UPI003C2E3372
MSAEAVLRLRPVVRAGRLPAGVHLRSWSGAVSLEGAAGLWPLWQRLAPLLAEGVSERDLDALCPEPALREAVRTLLDRLREHDLLVAVRPGDGMPPAVRGWLESAAPDPDAAWRSLGAASVTVRGEGRLAEAARDALARCHIGARTAPASDGLTLIAGVLVVRAASLGPTGFVTPALPSALADALADALTTRLAGPPTTPHLPDALTARLAGPLATAHLPDAPAARLAGAPATPHLPDAPAARLAGPPATPHLPGVGHGLAPDVMLAELLGAAAADRMVRAIAGWPARSGEVLLAKADPLEASYRPWPPAAPVPPARRVTLEEALRRAALLTDPDLGALPPAVPDGHPQLPLGLVVCPLPGREVTGAGPTTDTAHLAAVQAAAQALIGEDPARAAVGADELHACGVLLRRLADRQAAGLAPWRGPVPGSHWWRVLTRRLGRAVRLCLRDLDGAWHAEIVDSGGSRLGWAVERDRDEAAAMAAMAAVGTLLAPGPVTPVCGAVPCPDLTPEERDGDLGRWLWPAALSAHEEELQARLRELTGCLPHRDERPCAVSAAGFQIWRS